MLPKLLCDCEEEEEEEEEEEDPYDNAR